MENWKCSICDKYFTGMVCFLQHEASEKHKKKVRMLNNVASETSMLDDPDSGNQIYCSICMVYISGFNNYQKHVNSLDHATMIHKKSKDLMSQSVSTTFEIKTEQNQLVEIKASLTSPVTTVKPFAECKLCQKQFSGLKPYQQHLASANHMKRCIPSCDLKSSMKNDETESHVGNEKINNSLLNDPQFPSSTCNLSKTVAKPFAKCEICQIEFSESFPYQMHLVSDIHKEKKDSSQLLGRSCHGSQSLFKCNACVMIFSGPVPYQQHLVSNGHKKKMISAELSKQLATAESLSPFDSTVHSNLKQSNVNVLQMWYCDTCKKKCSGPIPYNSHLISRDHLKNVKKIKECGTLPCVGNDKSNSNLSDEATQLISRDHSENVKIQVMEENLTKIKESCTPTCVGNDKSDSNLSNEESSIANLNSEFMMEMQESSNKLNINLEDDDSSEKDSSEIGINFRLNLIDNDLREAIGYTFGPHEEILFPNAPKTTTTFRGG